MVFREVSVVEVREILRGWLAGAGLRTVAGGAGVDRKTARRYVAAAQATGVVREGGLGQLSDEVIGQVVEAVRPVRASGHGPAWAARSGLTSTGVRAAPYQGRRDHTRGTDHRMWITDRAGPWLAG